MLLLWKYITGGHVQGLFWTSAWINPAIHCFHSIALFAGWCNMGQKPLLAQTLGLSLARETHWNPVETTKLGELLAFTHTCSRSREINMWIIYHVKWFSFLPSLFSSHLIFLFPFYFLSLLTFCFFPLTPSFLYFIFQFFFFEFLFFFFDSSPSHSSPQSYNTENMLAL